MFRSEFPHSPSEWLFADQGEFLLQRCIAPQWVIRIESGRVALGLGEDGALVHQVGTVDGPAWLEAGAAVLGQASAVDAVAETRVTFDRLPLAAFRKWVAGLPPAAQDVLRDVSRAQRQQTELTLSRLAKDAQARCAEWLLRHSHINAQGSVAVLLQQRKRLIAAQLGIAPETLSRVLRHLRERSLISGSGRVVNLVDPSGLRSLAGV